jgi:hypothetical protein
MFATGLVIRIWVIPFSRRGVSFGRIDFPKTKSLQNNPSRRSFEMTAVDAVTPRKSALISFTLDCGSQQLNNFVIIKYEQVTA